MKYTPVPNDTPKVEQDYYHLEKYDSDCPICGIRSFSHLHRVGTLPKDLERVYEEGKDYDTFEAKDTPTYSARVTHKHEWHCPKCEFGCYSDKESEQMSPLIKEHQNSHKDTPKETWELSEKLRYRLIPDIPTCWELVKLSRTDQHHEKCSYRVSNGGLICDCAAFRIIYLYAGMLRELVAQELELARREVIENADIEKLSELEHEQWRSWMKYISEHFQTLSINTFLATRKANYLCDYKDLSEEEKEKDRVWARKVLATLREEKEGKL